MEKNGKGPTLERNEKRNVANLNGANARLEIQTAKQLIAKSLANTRQSKDTLKYPTMSNLDREAYKYAYNLPDSPVLEDEEDFEVGVFSRTKRPNILQSISSNTNSRVGYVPAVVDIENEQSFLSDGTIDLNDENGDIKVVTIDPEVIDLSD